MALAATVVLMSGLTGRAVYAGSDTAMLHEVEEVERARFKAWLAADAAAIAPMLGEDLVYCHSTGVCQNKKEVIDFVTSGKQRYLAMDIISIKARDIDGAVVVNGKLNMKVDTGGGRVEEFQGIYTDVYAKRKGKWVLVSWQSTRLPS
jgi:ketosteroid isomerase-like protein